MQELATRFLRVEASCARRGRCEMEAQHVGTRRARRSPRPSGRQDDEVTCRGSNRCIRWQEGRGVRKQRSRGQITDWIAGDWKSERRARHALDCHFFGVPAPVHGKSRRGCGRGAELPPRCGFPNGRCGFPNGHLLCRTWRATCCSSLFEHPLGAGGPLKVARGRHPAAGSAGGGLAESSDSSDPGGGWWRGRGSGALFKNLRRSRS